MPGDESRMGMPVGGPGGRRIPTGDLGHFDAMGRLHIDGREDDMIVSGGENIYPQPVEDVLMTHPAVAEAAVIGVPDERFGARLVAILVARPGREISAEQVRRYARQRLPRYMVPREVVVVDSIPHNGMGKILHGALRRERIGNQERMPQRHNRQ